MSKYWFHSEEDKKCIVPFERTTKVVASIYRLEDTNIEFKQEVLDDVNALRNIKNSLFTMFMDCRRQKKIVLDEEDCKFLWQIANKEIQLDFTKENEQ